MKGRSMWGSRLPLNEMSIFAQGRGGSCIALQRHCLRRPMRLIWLVLACVVPASLFFGASPTAALATCSLHSRRSRSSGRAHGGQRMHARRRGRRVRWHCACRCSGAGGAFVGASEVARQVYREASQPTAYYREADAVRARFGSSGEDVAQHRPSPREPGTRGRSSKHGAIPARHR